MAALGFARGGDKIEHNLAPMTSGFGSSTVCALFVKVTDKRDCFPDAEVSADSGADISPHTTPWPNYKS
jgi:hypothetical protein